jgi:hypothetical protein
MIEETSIHQTRRKRPPSRFRQINGDAPPPDLKPDRKEWVPNRKERTRDGAIARKGSRNGWVDETTPTMKSSKAHGRIGRK